MLALVSIALLTPVLPALPRLFQLEELQFVVPVRVALLALQQQEPVLAATLHLASIVLPTPVLLAQLELFRLEELQPALLAWAVPTVMPKLVHAFIALPVLVFRPTGLALTALQIPTPLLTRISAQLAPPALPALPPLESALPAPLGSNWAQPPALPAQPILTRLEAQAPVWLVPAALLVTL